MEFIFIPIFFSFCAACLLSVLRFYYGQLLINMQFMVAPHCVDRITHGDIGCTATAQFDAHLVCLRT